MTLSAYFMSKSVFDVQGCRALTLSLARLSCAINSESIVSLHDIPVLILWQVLIILLCYISKFLLPKFTSTLPRHLSRTRILCFEAMTLWRCRNLHIVIIISTSHLCNVACLAAFNGAAGVIGSVEVQQQPQDSSSKSYQLHLCQHSSGPWPQKNVPGRPQSITELNTCH